MEVKDIIEDRYAEIEKALRVERALQFWQHQHDYDGKSWDGIEKFHFELAKVADMVAVESAGWYSYPSSNREKRDGKDWRLIIPIQREARTAIAVNCHSILHDDVWTLTHTTYSTSDIDTDDLDMVYHEDHWTRSMLWSIEVLDKLSEDGLFDYSLPREDMCWRLGLKERLHEIKTQKKLELEAIYQEMFGVPSNMPVSITIAVAKWMNVEGKVGSYDYATDEQPWGVLLVSPQACEKGMDFAEHVIAHELIHAAIGKNTQEGGGHDGKFNILAKAMGIPSQYRD
jgi:predicted SprT family Zn-dependent metalloprotease